MKVTFLTILSWISISIPGCVDAKNSPDQQFVEGVLSAGGRVGWTEQPTDPENYIYEKAVYLNCLEIKEFPDLDQIPTKVEVLSLTGSTGVGHVLKTIGENNSLESLSLTGTDIRDDDINQLIHCNSLEGLSLSTTSLTDSSIDSIVAIKNLKSVSLWDTQITEHGIMKLKSKRPDLKVHWSQCEAGERFDALVKITRANANMLNGFDPGPVQSKATRKFPVIALQSDFVDSEDLVASFEILSEEPLMLIINADHSSSPVFQNLRKYSPIRYLSLVETEKSQFAIKDLSAIEGVQLRNGINCKFLNFTDEHMRKIGKLNEIREVRLLSVPRYSGQEELYAPVPDISLLKNCSPKSIDLRGFDFTDNDFNWVDEIDSLEEVYIGSHKGIHPDKSGEYFKQFKNVKFTIED